eukprot:5118540-Prymnesium_polylepis.1
MAERLAHKRKVDAAKPAELCRLQRELQLDPRALEHAKVPFPMVESGARGCCVLAQKGARHRCQQSCQRCEAKRCGGQRLRHTSACCRRWRASLTLSDGVVRALPDPRVQYAVASHAQRETAGREAEPVALRSGELLDGRPAHCPLPRTREQL